MNGTATTAPNRSDFRIIFARDKGGSVTGAARLLGIAYPFA